MSVSLTPEQVAAIHARLFLTCTTVEVRRWGNDTRSVEVMQFQRTRLIETVKVWPSGKVKVLS